MALNVDAYRRFFEQHNGSSPYEYQERAAQLLSERKNLVICAPTGAGKTLTVLTPFVFEAWTDRPTRLIYAVPLRTLAHGIFEEARKLAQAIGGNPDEFVKLQTGEQPDDPYFALGRIIVTTYDQVLSGLLSGPYGLSGSLHNINSAAVAGALVVFDEFHLMEPQRAFLTAAAGLHLFRDLAQSVWMTATATSPLIDLLRGAVDVVDASPSPEEVAELPTVAGVSRALRMSAEPLSTDAVLASSLGRTIVICNTVPRAQARYMELRRVIPADVPVLLLHSRFFRPDRAAKITELRRLFGKGADGRAVLVATQVIEAGIDISCDDLHTELCPMNALVQRAGRCARYPGETGSVHVYPLAADERWWLPYGGLDQPDRALTATAELLREHDAGATNLTPAVASVWVEHVHQEADAQALQAGWRGRLDETLRRIHQNSIQRSPTRVADLIREESVDEVTVIVARGGELPESPGFREAVTISRWQLRPLLEPNGERDRPAGVWTWSFGNPEQGVLAHWELLRDEDQLRRAFAVCISPEAAHYTSEVGLEIGVSGEQVSPKRKLPLKPGYKPLHRETWAQHATAVAREAERRVTEKDGVLGFLGIGFAARYGLTSTEIQSAAHTTGLFHDLGKLQRSWQRWAEAWQRTKEANYVHTEGLAHTDFDPENSTDREANRRFQPPRPPHAPASSLVACALLGGRLAVAPEREGILASAVVASILAHHGGWLPSAPNMGIDRLWDRWQLDLSRAQVRQLNTRLIDQLFQRADRGPLVRELLDVTTSSDAFGNHWPLVAYLMRLLRLADQRATSEGSEGVC